jgi:hypothetical protein
MFCAEFPTSTSASQHGITGRIGAVALMTYQRGSPTAKRNYVSSVRTVESCERKMVTLNMALPLIGPQEGLLLYLSSPILPAQA